VNTMLWICATFAVVIFGIMLHSVATFRDEPTRSRMRHHAWVEVGWTLIPILIVIAAAMPSLRTASDADVTAVAAVE
jgi:cytochrome c oxidase subunit II